MRAPAFQFYPKQWLGDDRVLAMSWDARAMHMHLICIAWQQDPPCTLPDDDEMICRWLGNPKRWDSLKNQIFAAWKMVDGRWLQSGLLEQFNRQSAFRETRKNGANARWGKDAHASEMECTKDALQSSSSSTKLSPDSGSELMAACWLLEELGSVADNGTRRVAAEAIRLLAKEGGTVHTAAEYMLSQGKSAVAAGEIINRFWFSDQRYRPEEQRTKKNGKSPPNPGANQPSISEEEARLRWESMSDAFKAANPWEAGSGELHLGGCAVSAKAER